MAMTTVVMIAVESPLQDKVTALLLKADMVAAQLYPGARHSAANLSSAGVRYPNRPKHATLAQSEGTALD